MPPGLTDNPHKGLCDRINLIETFYFSDAVIRVTMLSGVCNVKTQANIRIFFIKWNTPESRGRRIESTMA